MWASKMKNFVAKYGKLQKEENFSLKGTADYLPVDTTLQIQAPQPGIYYLKAVPEGKVGEPGGALMYVTALRVIYRPCLTMTWNWLWWMPKADILCPMPRW